MSNPFDILKRSPVAASPKPAPTPASDKKYNPAVYIPVSDLQYAKAYAQAFKDAAKKGDGIIRAGRSKKVMAHMYSPDLSCAFDRVVPITTFRLNSAHIVDKLRPGECLKIVIADSSLMREDRQEPKAVAYLVHPQFTPVIR